ncbi:OsmC family protein [Streptomyces chrestomyceticus]|uniref:OsmC family protein n=1 Tax=Streptomyces chrestomyceticus TaxID=68185 RepID=A0ABU7WRK3_9ACTN
MNAPPAAVARAGARCVQRAVLGEEQVRAGDAARQVEGCPPDQYPVIGFSRCELIATIPASRVSAGRQAMVEAVALPAPWQVRVEAGDNVAVADTLKAGTGGSAGMRPHELLEASLATCMTISARMAPADLGIIDAEVRVRVHLEREETATRFRYELLLAPELEAQRPAIEEHIARSPVRSTLSKPLTFEPA